MDTGMKWLFCILVALPILSWGQENLVPNPSFEDNLGCPENAGQWFNTLYWDNANNASPDYYHSCGPPLIFPPDTFPHMGTPDNAFGSQIPHSGNAYMGIYCYSFGNLNVREYVQVELSDSLIYGIRYIVGFYVSLAEKSKYSIRALGAYFSSESLYSSDYLFFDVEPQVVNDSSYQLTDTTEWIHVSDTFLSRVGGETFITIGNFRSDIESDTLLLDPAPTLGTRFAYYYVDDVSVIALDSIPEGIADAQALQHAVHPNPSAGPFTLTWQSTTAAAYAFTLYDAQGREAYAHGGHTISGTTTVQLQLAHLPAGIYFGRLAADDGIRNFKWVRE
jgi:hypothetical protein